MSAGRAIASASDEAPPPELVRDVLLLDGSTLRLRAPTPDDAQDIDAFYQRLSPESRYMRFHGYGRTDTAARAYAEANGVDRVALIARKDGRVIAAAGYDVLREPDTAEVAFAVAEDLRRRGAATRLLEQLATIGSERGIRRFDAEVLSANRPMLAVFENAGFAIRRKGAFGEVTVSLDITPTAAVRQLIEARNHIAAVASLRPLLSPRSVAVADAGTTPGDAGAAVLHNVVEEGFNGVAMPLNADGEVVHSIRAARSFDELEEVPELVIVAAPPNAVPEIAAQAAEKGAKALLVLGSTQHSASGDAATADWGDRLLEIARAGGLRLLGPGSLGVVNTDPDVSLNATVMGAGVPAGRLAICSQSGAIGIGLLGHAAARRLGISSFVSLGERLDVSTNDLLELWEEDERTAAVMLYVETFGNPERFAHIAQRVSRRKPILAVKGRRAAQARRDDASSHTAAALRGDAVIDALFHQAGVLRFRSGEELFNAALFFESQPLPRGRRVRIISNSAGIATLAADACATRGLVVSEAESDTENPLVLGGAAAAEDYAAALAGALGDDSVDAAMVYYVDLLGAGAQAILAEVSRVALAQSKPVVASIVERDGRLPPAPPVSIPNFVFPEACAGVLGRAAERREWLSKPVGQPPAYRDCAGEEARRVAEGCLERAGEAGCWLTLAETEDMLTSHGIVLAKSVRCADVEAAVAAAGELAGPVALKADFPAPAHAADVDAVLLGLQGEPGVRAGWRELQRRVGLGGREWSGAVVQPLIAPGVDLLLGAVSDPDLGPVMAVGLGGRQAGLAGTAAFRLLPSTDAEADELINASEGVVAALEGFRGGAMLDREALRELVLRFSLLLTAVPELVEADLNPVRLMAEGYTVLDARMRLEHRRRPARVRTW